MIVTRNFIKTSNLALKISTALGFWNISKTSSKVLINKSKFWMYGLNLFLIIIYSYDLIKSSKFSRKKLSASALFRHIFLYLLLQRLNLKSHQIFKIKNIIDKLMKQRRNLLQNSYASFNYVCIIFIGIYYMILVLLMKFFIQNPFLTGLWFDFFSFGINKNIDGRYKTGYIILFTVLNKHLTVVMPILLMIYINSLFYIIQRVLQDIIHQTKSRLCYTDPRCSILNFIKQYQSLHLLANMIQTVYSLPLLFLTIFQFMETFALFSNLFGFSGGNGIYDIEQSLVRFALSFGFLLTVYWAAEGERQDRLLRKMIKEISYYLSISEDTIIYADNLLQLLRSKDKIIFHTWGVIKLNRKFLLSFLGTALSYNILFVQLN